MHACHKTCLLLSWGRHTSTTPTMDSASPFMQPFTASALCKCALRRRYDAVGLRLHSGRHAAALNLIITELPPDHPVQTAGSFAMLREQLGHTPLQVSREAAVCCCCSQVAAQGSAEHVQRQLGGS